MKIHKIAWLYLILVLIKIVIISLVPSPSIYADEYIYSKIAKDVLQEGSYSIEGNPTSAYPPLYSILISPSYLFQNMEIIYFVMKLINSIILSLIIFPVFFLAKEFLDERKALFISFLISILPAYLVTSSYIMSENLFYPLVAFTIYLTYKSFTTNKRKYYLLSGLTLGLCFLTKSVGIALVPLTFLSFFIAHKKSFKYVILHYLTSLIVILPWTIRNISLFGFKISSIIGGGAGGATDKALGIYSNFLIFLNWFILYLGYLILASGIIFTLYIYLKSDDPKFNTLRRILIIAILFFILLAANHTSIARIDYDSPFKLFTYRPIGRYIDSILSVTLLVGFIAFNKKKKDLPKEISLVSLLILLISSQLVIAPLFPFNNQSLTILGVTKSAIDYIFYSTLNLESVFHWTSFLIITLLILISSIILLKIKNKKIINYFLISFIILNSLLAIFITSWNARENWYNHSQSQLGLFLNDFDKEQSKIMIDLDYPGAITKGSAKSLYEPHGNFFFVSVIGFWLNDKLYIDSVSNSDNYDYIISKKELSHKILNEKEGIKIYQVKE